jgi:hypothetical protein
VPLEAVLSRALNHPHVVATLTWRIMRGEVGQGRGRAIKRFGQLTEAASCTRIAAGGANALPRPRLPPGLPPFHDQTRFPSLE